jgi:hypothetical protein
MRKAIHGAIGCAALASLATPASATVFDIDLTATNHYPGGTGSFTVFGTLDPFVINPGDTVNVTLTFSPLLTLEHTASIQLSLYAQCGSGGTVGGPAIGGTQYCYAAGPYQSGDVFERNVWGGAPIGNYSSEIFPASYTGPPNVNASITLAAYSVGVYVAPEPASWAMLLTGFVGLGMIGYYKTRKSGVLARRSNIIRISHGAASAVRPTPQAHARMPSRK